MPLFFWKIFFSSKDLEQLHILFGNQTMQIYMVILRDFPYKKVQCLGLVIHLPPLSTREVTTQPRIALADSQVPFGLDAFKCYNCGVSAWMSSDGVL